MRTSYALTLIAAFATANAQTTPNSCEQHEGTFYLVGGNCVNCPAGYEQATDNEENDCISSCPEPFNINANGAGCQRRVNGVRTCAPFTELQGSVCTRTFQAYASTLATTCTGTDVRINGQCFPEGTTPAPTATPPTPQPTIEGQQLRGVVDSCDQHGLDWELQNGLCYRPCDEGFSGEGPLCYVNCPDGYRNDGIHCAKPYTSYGRGAGRAPGIRCSGCSGCSGCTWGGCSGCSGCSSCNLNDCRDGEERNGGLCYPRCRDGFNAAGCCICSPQCPAMTTDTGVSCLKESRTRGVGRAVGCRENETYEDGLCYMTIIRTDPI